MKKLTFPRALLFTCTFLLQLSAPWTDTHAAPGNVDLLFDPGSGVNGGVNAVAMQPDGKMIVGGSFQTVKGLVRPAIARLHADGSGDESFVYPGLNPSIIDVRAIVLQGDGKVLVGYASGIIRLNMDGTIDESFILPLITDIDLQAVPVSLIALQPDGKILIAGNFTFVHEALNRGVARFNADGSPDASFNSGFGVVGPFWSVDAMALQADGKILLGGRFLGVHETLRRNIARLNADGSLDETFDATLEENDYVTKIVLQPDGNSVVAGALYSGMEATRTSLARLNTLGVRDSTFTPVLESVTEMLLQTDGRLLVSGAFETSPGVSEQRIVRLEEDASVDASFNAGGSDLTNSRPITVQADGKVIVASVITGGAASKFELARLNADGIRDNTFDASGGLDNGVNSVAIQEDGKIVIGGFFSFINDTAAPGIARLQASGNLDNSFKLDAAALGTFFLATLQPDGKLIVAGYSTDSDGISPQRGGIARLNSNGTVDPGFNPGTGLDGGQAAVIALQQDGKVLVGGLFASVNGVTRQGLVRLNTDGTVDTGFNLNKENAEGVESISVQADGKVLVGGRLKFAGDERFYALVRLNADGSRDGTFDFPRIGAVRSIVLQPDGKVLAAGAFSTPENEAYPDWIARLNADGSIDNTFHPDFAFRPGADPDRGVVSARSLVLQADGKVLVAGSYLFNSDGEGNAHYLQGVYRLHADGRLDTTFSPGTGTHRDVYVIAAQEDGKVLAGGNFLEFNSVMRPFLVRLEVDSVALPPSLSINRSNLFAVISWPAPASDYALEESTNLTAWTGVTESSSTNAGSISITTPTTDQRFFRLARP